MSSITIQGWGVLWRSENSLDGKVEHLIHCPGQPQIPRLFKTRREARAWANLEYGYIRRRPDLQAEPHGWKVPKVVYVTIAGVIDWR